MNLILKLNVSKILYTDRLAFLTRCITSFCNSIWIHIPSYSNPPTRIRHNICSSSIPNLNIFKNI